MNWVTFLQDFFKFNVQGGRCFNLCTQQRNKIRAVDFSVSYNRHICHTVDGPVVGSPSTKVMGYKRVALVPEWSEKFQAMLGTIPCEGRDIFLVNKETQEIDYNLQEAIGMENNNVYEEMKQSESLTLIESHLRLICISVQLDCLKFVMPTGCTFTFFKLANPDHFYCLFCNAVLTDTIGIDSKITQERAS